jgi:hypothetical protein
MKVNATLNKTPELPFGSRKMSVSCLTALALLAIVTPAKANLVVNGSFETTSLTASGQVFFNNTPDVSGWRATTITSPTNTSVPLGFLYFPGHANDQLSDQFGANNFQLAQGPTYPATSPDHGKFLAIDSAPGGGGNTNYQGSFGQTISGLTVGAKYALSFYQAAGQQNGFTGATTDWWSVTFGTQTLLSTVMSNPSQSFQPWNFQKMTFTATATSQVLTFLSQGTGSGLPPFIFLDGVDLDRAPEPSTLAYAALGLSGLIAAWRLRNKRA